MPNLSTAGAFKVSDLIRGALRLLGAIGVAETPEAAELSDALYSLNSMLDSWNLERLMIYAINSNAYTLTPGKGTYTLGPGGDWDDARPVKIERALLRVLNQPQPMDLPISLADDDDWANITLKTFQGPWPQTVHNHNDYPQTTLAFWPVPTLANQVVLDVWNVMARFSAVTDEVVLPPGYERALRYGLAIELAPEYGKSVTPEIAETYINAKAAIKRANMETPTMRCELTGGQYDDVSLADFYRGGR